MSNSILSVVVSFCLCETFYDHRCTSCTSAGRTVCGTVGTPGSKAVVVIDEANKLVQRFNSCLGKLETHEPLQHG